MQVEGYEAETESNESGHSVGLHGTGDNDMDIDPNTKTPVPSSKRSRITVSPTSFPNIQDDLCEGEARTKQKKPVAGTSILQNEKLVNRESNNGTSNTPNDTCPLTNCIGAEEIEEREYADLSPEATTVTHVQSNDQSMIVLPTETGEKKEESKEKRVGRVKMIARKPRRLKLRMPRSPIHSGSSSGLAESDEDTISGKMPVRNLVEDSSEDVIKNDNEYELNAQAAKMAVNESLGDITTKQVKEGEPIEMHMNKMPHERSNYPETPKKVGVLILKRVCLHLKELMRKPRYV